MTLLSERKNKTGSEKFLKIERMLNWKYFESELPLKKENLQE